MRLSMKIMFLASTILMPLCLYFLVIKKPSRTMLPKIQSVEEIIKFFPTNKAELESRAEDAMSDALESLEALYAIEPSKRTFDNTMGALDLANARFNIVTSLTQLLTLVSPEEELRKAAETTLVKLQAFEIDHFGLNPRLYAACEDYTKRLEDPSFASQENLSDAKKYFKEQLMKEFRRKGLQLPVEKQEKVKNILKALSAREVQFEQNISSESRTLDVDREGLTGWDDASIDAVKKNDAGKYMLRLDHPTFDKIFNECAVGETRKAYFKLYMQRAYPANEKELATIIELRDQLAQLLGYPSYAHLDIDSQMAKTPDTVVKFIDEVAQKGIVKAEKELKVLKEDLPEGVTLTKDGKFYPWDYTFVKNYYKKKHLAIDEAAIAEFFPIETTLPALLKVYEQFFGLTFKNIEDKHIWHKDTQLLAVYKGGVYIGTVVLDIYPRPFKYSHACELTVIPSVKRADGERYPALIAVVTNFPPSKPGQPALLKRMDLITFFHEFGHAIHALLGATEMATQSGTGVKTDFVEMPSQMLEDWMWDPVILKMVSSHYKTKEPLSDDLIEKIRAIKSFDTGHFIAGQCALASTSLAYYLPGAQKDIPGIWKEMQERFRRTLLYIPENKNYSAFGHLTNYGSKYYGYMWSLVFACDLFSHIKSFGLLNPEIGERYINEVIGRGGSKDPMELLIAFLGRKPNSEAFFKDLGINEEEVEKA